MPKTTFNRSINKLIKVGLAYKSGNIVHLKSKKQITEEFTNYEPNPKKKIRFLKIDTDKDIIQQIQLHRLNTKLEQVKYAVIQQKAQNKSARKALVKLEREAFVKIANSTIAKTLKKSKSSAHYAIKKLEKAKLIQVKRSEFCCIARKMGLKVWEEIKKSQKLFFGFEIKNCFWFNGRVFFSECSEYRIGVCS